MQEQKSKRKLRPAQSQRKQPGLETKMVPRPGFISPKHIPTGKLNNKAAIITGGDSGIGRAVAVLFAREGCDTAIVYYNEHEDARITKEAVENENRKCILIPGSLENEKFCKRAVSKAFKEFGRLDIVVNNAAVQFPQEEFRHITRSQLEKTFRTNIFSFFYITQAALEHLEKGSTIINTTSVTAYRGSGQLIDYSSTKGAIVSFTRSLSAQLISKGIRVNGVAPGPIWTPLIPATFPPKHVQSFGSDVPMGRAGEPYEVASCYLFLASDDSSYITGQIIHPNGGEIING